jgi:hypothetical protein
MMVTSKMVFLLKKAPFPTIMTIVSFMLFIMVYVLLTVAFIEPNYYLGLIFAVPFICFGIIAVLTAIEEMNNINSIVITVLLTVVLGFAAFVAFVTIFISAATTETTDINRYHKVLKLNGYPNNQLIQYFPNKIPSSDENIKFSYNPAFLQGGEVFALRFETDSDAIKSYSDLFSPKAKWIGIPSDSLAKTNGIFLGEFNRVGYTKLPDDFTIYLFGSKPYKPNDWNHGELSLVAISEQRKEIIFLADKW